ncbi:hypothetical protein FL966_00445 [Caproiciproducens galactitolivorans]|uniref:Peptidase propeptide and YPEB domain protein n=1 Tax=Caproiciproducens galactitolivorans TaxID=642589 RepID=A0A4Z0XXS1_9FIRM|nr:hypothetical protein [Caproiciproducens galactitolivorans]QEY33653.1 hypothetical protein FL966_00445 [Caproiciproducens galactitolivorans]TGJ76224.1 hypothetical protein CAGA_16870 [Caproiciproducens galactitolivorans]
MKIKKVTVLIVLTLFLLIPAACTKAGSTKEQSAELQPTLTVQNIDLEEAESVIKNTIRLNYNQYRLELMNENLSYGGDQYYQFEISDHNRTVGPSIIVSKSNGMILCYYPDHSVSDVYQDEVFKTKC